MAQIPTCVPSRLACEIRDLGKLDRIALAGPLYGHTSRDLRHNQQHDGSDSDLCAFAKCKAFLQHGFVDGF